MTVLALTIFISTALACFFLILFVANTMAGHGGPQEALLPLQEDTNHQPVIGGDVQ